MGVWRVVLSCVALVCFVLCTLRSLSALKNAAVLGSLTLPPQTPRRHLSAHPHAPTAPRYPRDRLHRADACAAG